MSLIFSVSDTVFLRLHHCHPHATCIYPDHVLGRIMHSLDIPFCAFCKQTRFGIRKRVEIWFLNIITNVFEIEKGKWENVSFLFHSIKINPQSGHFF